MRRTPHCLLIAWCLLSAWALYGGLELAEELKLVVKVQASARDLDMEALVQLASGLKPDVPDLAEPQGRPLSIHFVFSVVPVPQRAHGDHGAHLVPALSSLRLHQYLSVYRI